MYRDNNDINNISGHADLSAVPGHSVMVLLNFIDRTISGFRDYFLPLKDSERENRISEFLIHYFNACLRKEKDGFPPFGFCKNPTQISSGKETDVGVVISSINTPPITIVEFEAKRLSNSSHNKEYVTGTRGGIERFKRGEHASHLTVCGMFGYVQSKTTSHWITAINNWITDLSTDNSDKTIDWSRSEEKLSEITILGTVSKLGSIASRMDNDNLTIYHYFINLVD